MYPQRVSLLDFGRADIVCESGHGRAHFYTSRIIVLMIMANRASMPYLQT